MTVHFHPISGVILFATLRMLERLGLSAVHLPFINAQIAKLPLLLCMHVYCAVDFLTVCFCRFSQLFLRGVFAALTSVQHTLSRWGWRVNQITSAAVSLTAANVCIKSVWSLSPHGGSSLIKFTLICYFHIDIYAIVVAGVWCCFRDLFFFLCGDFGAGGVRSIIGLPFRYSRAHSKFSALFTWFLGDIFRHVALK